MKSLAVLITFLPAIVLAASPFRNLNQIQSQLGFSKYYSLSNTNRPLKVAVLDKGFYGYEAEIGKTLPSKTRYVAGPLPDPDDQKVDHGLKMAQILTALMTNDMTATQWQPNLTLYNVFGFTNFQSAIADAIAQKVDVILYSEVWEYGGNNDGQGFFNTEVTKAAKAGIIWVNAAGNFDLTTYNSGITTGTDNWVKLPDQNSSLNFRCPDNAAGGQCPVKIVLAWNDFKNNIDDGTNKDLDLVLTDDLLNIIEVGGLKQSADKNEARPGYSKYPREIVEANLKPGSYFIRVKDQSKNFTAQDRLRIVVETDAEVTMTSHSSGETLLNPADNPNVITVGASDSDRSSVSISLHKPDILAPSSVILDSGDEFRGSSNSAAIVAAGVGLLKTQNPQKGRQEILNMIRLKTVWNWNVPGLSLQMLGFMPADNQNCFSEGQYSPLPGYVATVLDQGGKLVQTTAALRIMTPYDPLLLAPYLHRRFINDMVVTTPRGFEIYPRGAGIPADSVEIFQRPYEAGLCTPPSAGIPGKSFYLP